MKDIFLAISAGLLLGFSQPFYVHNLVDLTSANHWGLLACIGYAPLFWVLAEQNLKRCFLLSTLAITVHHTVVLYWIYYALHVHGHIAPPLASVITVLLSFILGMMGASFMTLARFLSQRFAISYFLVAPFALCASEYFRNYYFFGGFPWGNVGYSLGRITAIAQTASLVGVYGLVFFAAVLNSCLCLALEKRRSKAGVVFGAVGVLLLASSFAFGALRLLGVEQEYAPTVRVALLQGNIPQEVKSSRMHASAIMDIYLELMRKAKALGAELMVWPESSHPKLLSKDIADFGFDYADRGASIIGAVVYGENAEDKSYYVHNSGFITDFHGDIVTRYDKSHLVPFGEYVPWPMSGIVDRIVPGMGAFRPGTDFVATSLKLSDNKTISIGTTVCYEGIFPEISRRYAQGSAELLVNLTNDAWYGNSSAPFQHLLMYRLRSVEAGLPFIRATNTGVSAWIDVYGRTHDETRLFERTVVIADIPLVHKRTIYAMVGDVLPLLSLLILMLAYVVAVLPVHQFFKARQWGKIAVMAWFTAIPIASTLYFHQAALLTDESARTKNFFVFILSLVLMIGVLSKSKRSRSVLMVAATAIVAISVALAIFESLYFLAGIVVGLLIYWLAFRMKDSDTLIK